jgi:hypothetical protein
MGCQCAPVIKAEMADWVNLGGSNSGCCGNDKHTYGFHRAGGEVPVSDYSRCHEAGRPFNMSYACAGDFAHNGKANLRAVHANVLARLMAGDPALSMICEFIGQPWYGKPVYYWCRWAGVGTLKRYTGKGHDTWSHISWWRSRADQRAYLYVGAGGGTAPVPAVNVPPAGSPAYPGHELRFAPHTQDAAVKTWQARMKIRGWDIDVDGFFGPVTRNVIRKFQDEKHLGTDGILGPKTWNAAWSSPVTR